MVSGTWSSTSGATPTTLTLKPDGTFTERGLPADAGETSTLNIPADGTGGWHIDALPGEARGVVFEFSPKVFMELLVERVGSTAVMYYDMGDPDAGVSGQYEFTKLR